MALLDEINSHVAQNAVEAEHEATLRALKTKYQTLQPNETAGKIVKRHDISYGNWAIIFDDNTYIYASVDQGHEGGREVIFFDPGMEWVVEQGLMSPEDVAEWERVCAFYDNKSKVAEDHRLLHQIRARFSPEQLKELLS